MWTGPESVARNIAEVDLILQVSSALHKTISRGDARNETNACIFRALLHCVSRP